MVERIEAGMLDGYTIGPYFREGKNVIPLPVRLCRSANVGALVGQRYRCVGYYGALLVFHRSVQVRRRLPPRLACPQQQNNNADYQIAPE